MTVLIKKSSSGPGQRQQCVDGWLSRQRERERGVEEGAGSGRGRSRATPAAGVELRVWLRSVGSL